MSVWWKHFLNLSMIFLLVGCQAPIDQTQTMSPGATTTEQHVTPTSTPSPVLIPVEATLTPLKSVQGILVGAGDISICGQKGDDLTADLLANISGTIYTLGDNSNENGTSYEYLNCFGPSWGRFLDRLYPTPGNHDYLPENGSAYYDYFPTIASVRGNGYYSYDIGNWHIIALNSVIDTSKDSLQAEWLREDLVSHPALCTLAYWHHPRWTSGTSGNNGHLATIWQILYEHGVDVVVNGNEHMYERFAPMDPTGALDLEHGIREFVAGTGGVSHYPLGEIQPNSRVRDNTAFGVLKFTLYSDGYDWEFIPVDAAGFTDSGSESCH
jgi:3',5'-cyclic AMP phosphodiesterase CpdA